MYIFSFRCHLIDDVGNLVTSHEFKNIDDLDRHRYEEQSLASRYGYLFNQLLSHNVYELNSKVDYQSVCKYSDSIPSVSYLFNYCT